MTHERVLKDTVGYLQEESKTMACASYIRIGRPLQKRSCSSKVRVGGGAIVPFPLERRGEARTCDQRPGGPPEFQPV